MHPYQYETFEFEPMMAAEDIFIGGSIPVDLPNTKRHDLMGERLELVLMYAIGSGARQKTEAAGKIALGIKESMQKDELFLRNIGAMGFDREDGRVYPTVAGLLMFGHEYDIVREMPDYFLDYRELLDPKI